MGNTRFRTIILLLVLFPALLGLGSINASLISNTTIRGSGMISVIPPLHVEGPYIKDGNGNTVHLRGVNKVEWRDIPGGCWMGNYVNTYSQWNQADVAAELDIMRSWGINFLRCIQSSEQWIYDIEHHRQMLKEFIQLAADRGIYVMLCDWSVRNYAGDGGQSIADPLPYPPYQLGPGASSIITSEQDYIDYMVSRANELKGYQNVIFELWNEPNGDDTAKASWFSVSQRCINGIRATGADNLIVFQWGYMMWVNLDYPPPSNPADTMDWVFETDCPRDSNLVYSTHIYRYLGSFQRLPSNAWTLGDIQLAFQYYRFADVLAQYPLMIGEIGCDVAWTGDELTHELSAFDTCLTLFDQMGIQYAPWWWRGIGVLRLHSGPPSFTANEAGQILKAHLLG